MIYKVILTVSGYYKGDSESYSDWKPVEVEKTFTFTDWTYAQGFIGMMADSCDRALDIRIVKERKAGLENE